MSLKRIGIAVMVLAICTYSLGVMSRSVHAGGGMSFGIFATHPYASKTGYDSTSVNYYTGQKLCSTNWCPSGQSIVDMGITDSGQLIAGYGDWESNVDTFGVAAGGVYAVPLNLSDGSWDMEHAVRAGSEALINIREIRGDVYAPTTDPSEKLATGQTVFGSGYVTSRGGWHFVTDGLDNIHVFDIVSPEPGVLLNFGAHRYNGVTISSAVSGHSSDNGATWSPSTADISTDPNPYDGSERYYWGAQIGPKTYTQAMQTSPAVPGKVYDTTTGTWSTYGVSDSLICPTFSPHLVQSFNNAIVCYGGENNGMINVFDGASVRQVRFSNAAVSAKDFYIARDGYLYMLDSSGSIYRTKTLSGTFEYIGSTGASMTDTAQSIAVFGDYIYIGSDNGKIYRSAATMSTTAPLVPEYISSTITSYMYDGKTHTVTITGKDFMPGAIVTVGGIPMSVTYLSRTQLNVIVDTAKLPNTSFVKTGSTDALTAYARPLDLVISNPNGQGAQVLGAYTGTKLVMKTAATTTTSPSTTSPTGTTTTTNAGTKKSVRTLSAGGLLANTGVSEVSAFMIAGVGAIVVACFVIIFAPKRKLAEVS